MPTPSVIYKFKSKTVFFFQRLMVSHRIAKDRGLSRIGALVRGALRRTLRVTADPRRASSPGTPPYCHTQGGLRVIAFDAGTRDVIIGPVKFPGSNFFNQPVPHIHEFGGTYFSRKGFYQYPERSYESYTLRQLHARGLIPIEYSSEVRKLF